NERLHRRDVLGRLRFDDCVFGHKPSSLRGWTKSRPKQSRTGSPRRFAPRDDVTLAARRTPGERMMALDRLLETLIHHMRVDLGRGDISMAEQGLHRAKIRAAL